MFGFLKKKPIQPPGNSQIKLCKRLGLEITPKMSRADVSKLIEDALQQEEYRAIFDEIEREREEEFECEERAEYGDEVVDELKKWEKLCDPDRHYIVVYKRGGKIQSDVVEFEYAEILELKKPSVSVSLLLPKTHRDADGEPGDYYIEWEREISLMPKQILLIESLPQQIDIFDMQAFELAKAKALKLQIEYAD